MHTQNGTLTPHEAAIRHGRLLEYLSVAWMGVEAAVGIPSGILAGSIALVGFGADSVIELFSSAVLLWRLHEGSMGQQREHTALKLVGGVFLHWRLMSRSVRFAISFCSTARKPATSASRLRPSRSWRCPCLHEPSAV